MRVVLLLMLVIGSSLLAVGSGEELVGQIKHYLSEISISVTARQEPVTEQTGETKELVATGQPQLPKTVLNSESHDQAVLAEKPDQHVPDTVGLDAGMQQDGVAAGIEQEIDRIPEVAVVQTSEMIEGKLVPTYSIAGTDDKKGSDEKSGTKGGKRSVAKTVPDVVPDLPAEAVLGTFASNQVMDATYQPETLVEPEPVEYQDVYTIQDIHETNREALLVLESMQWQSDR